MNTFIDSQELQHFHRLQTVDRDQHATAVKRMTRAELRRYVTYLREIQRLSIEDYETLVRRQFPMAVTTDA